MKILLVQPAKSPLTIGGEDVFMYEPLALEYLAAGVAHEHDVRILDMRIEKDFDRILTEFSPDIVGITAYTVHVNVARALFERVKMWNPRTLTVVGGHHATVMPDDFLSPYIDLVVMGEGVFVFREIVERFGAGKSFESLPGTAVRHDNKLIKAPSNSSIDLDSFPFPYRKLTSGYRAKYYSEWMKPLASIRTSRGCPYRCKFCAEWKVAEGRYFKREPEKVVEELAQISEPYVFFADDESLLDTGRMTLLAGLIKQAGIKKRYFLYGRSDTIARHPGLLEVWRGIGLERVFIGLEFVRDEDLTYIRKNSTADDNEKAIRTLQRLGIEIYASFIVRPEFSKSDFTALRSYCRRSKLNYATFAVLTPLPGTDLFDEVREKLITRNPDYFDFIHTLLPTTLPIKEFYAEVRRLYMKAVPLSRQLSLLNKMRVVDIPGVIANGRRFYSRLEKVHADYEA